MTDEEAGFCVRIAEEVRIDLVARYAIPGVAACQRSPYSFPVNEAKLADGGAGRAGCWAR